LRVASGAEPGLTESSRVALDAADACRTAVVVAAELDRLVPGGHRLIRDELRRTPPHRKPPNFGVLVEMRCLLLAGPVSLHVVAGLFRYAADIGDAIEDLITEGWLKRSANAVAATPITMELLDAMRNAAGRALEPAWGLPLDLLARMNGIVLGAIGSSAGPVFDALATVEPPAGPAVRLFERCNALRHHRADAHAAAWQTVGLTATSVQEVSPTDPVRADVETATNRVASRAFRPLSTVERAGLHEQLRRLSV
jgi:hypothetical protein